MWVVEVEEWVEMGKFFGEFVDVKSDIGGWVLDCKNFLFDYWVG